MATTTAAVTDDLVFVETPLVLRASWDLAVYDTIQFAETATSPRVIVVAVFDRLALGESGESGDQTQAVEETLAFQERAQVPTARQWVYENLTLVERFSFGAVPDVLDALSFEETTTGTRTRGATDLVTFAETIGLARDYTRALGDTLTFTEGGVLYNTDPVAVTGDLPAIAPTTTLTTPAGTIVLPSPDFGNTEELGALRINRKSMGGTFIIYQAAGWPTTDTLTATFSYLSEPQADQLRSLIGQSVGQLVTFTDQEGTSWLGVILSADCTITQVGRFNYQAAFQFLMAD